MIDILIPLGAQSKYNDVELKYSLRSIEKHLTGYSNIFIIGERPSFLQNIIHIPCTDSSNNWMRSHNIYKKILTGCQDKRLSDNFLYMNDDHYLLQDFEAHSFPFLHRGPICLDLRNQPQYKQMNNTIKALSRYAAKDFDIHCPIVFHKFLFAHAFENLEWPEHGYGIKTFYANWNNVNGKFCEDLKFDEPAMRETIYKVLEGRGWFSIGDHALKSGGMKEVLQELYPEKSIYEN